MGNPISITAGGKTTAYTFDVWGNMTSAAEVEYTYNVQELRTSKTVGNTTTSFIPFIIPVFFMLFTLMYV